MIWQLDWNYFKNVWEGIFCMFKSIVEVVVWQAGGLQKMFLKCINQSIIKSTEGNTWFSSWWIMHFYWCLSSCLLFFGNNGNVVGLVRLKSNLLLGRLVGRLVVVGLRFIIPGQGEVALSSWSVMNFNWGCSLGMLWEIH